jgi:hypothetical protein
MDSEGPVIDYGAGSLVPKIVNGLITSHFGNLTAYVLIGTLTA